MIELDHLLVRYPRTARPAVGGVSLTIRPGEVVGFIGPNGAGKTTTLRVLATLLAPTAGRAAVAGHDVMTEAAAARRRLGFLADEFGVPERLSCAEYLAFFAVLQEVAPAEREAAVERVLALSGLAGHAHAPASSLSRGMTQRLGLARVLLHDPDVLLLDEPASGLDPRARVEVREVLGELAALGKTVLVSSHVLSDLAAACTSVVIVESGRLAFEGSVPEALAAARQQAPAAVLVAVLQGGARLSEVLATSSLEVQSVEESADGLTRVVLPAGTEDPAARVASVLAASGLLPVHLEEEALDLEQAFLLLTEGRVA